MAFLFVVHVPYTDDRLEWPGKLDSNIVQIDDCVKTGEDPEEEEEVKNEDADLDKENNDTNKDDKKSSAESSGSSSVSSDSAINTTASVEQSSPSDPIQQENDTVKKDQKDETDPQVTLSEQGSTNEEKSDAKEENLENIDKVKNKADDGDTKQSESKEEEGTETTGETAEVATDDKNVSDIQVNKGKESDEVNELDSKAKSGEDDPEADSGHADEETVTEEEASKKHESVLTPLVPKRPLYKIVEQVLTEANVDNFDMRETKNKEFWKFSFVQEDSQRCEKILIKLKSIGIGQSASTSLSIFPSTVHVSSVTEKSTPDTDDTDNINSEDESKFIQSIKSRLVVDQVVLTIMGNAKFTFDYLLLLILASVISCLGLVENSSVVLVASMLISPLMGPILAITLGHVVNRYDIRNLGLRSELAGLLICLFVGFLFGLISGGIGLQGAVWGSSDAWPTTEMTSRGMLRSLWVGVLIAIPSGAGVAVSVLGGNAGSLVGVAISASLLPPACNAGMLWAYSILSAMSPPDVVMPLATTVMDTDAPTVQDIVSNLTATTIAVNSTILSNTTLTTPSVITSTVTPALGSCLPLLNNAYKSVYSCNIALDAFLLGLCSLFLTLLNISCILVMGVFVLWIKEVTPHTAGTSSIDNFWQEDVKVARNYYTTSKGHASKSLGKEFLEEWKKIKEAKRKKHDGVKGDSDDEMEPEETMGMVNLIARMEESPSVRYVLGKLSPSSPTTMVSKSLTEDYNKAAMKFNSRLSKDPSVYLAESAVDKKLGSVHKTIHSTYTRRNHPDIAEIRSRFRRGHSLYIEPIEVESSPEPFATHSDLGLSNMNSKLFKRRKQKVKFQVTKVEEEQELV